MNKRIKCLSPLNIFKNTVILNPSLFQKIHLLKEIEVKREVLRKLDHKTLSLLLKSMNRLRIRYSKNHYGHQA